MGYITVADLQNSGVLASIKSCTDTARLQGLIDYCSLIIDSYTNTDFNNYVGETICVDGEGSNILRLPKRIYNVSSVKDIIDNTVYSNVAIINKNMNLITRESTFSDDCANIEVVGDWGWETIPSNVITVLVALCNQNFESLVDAERLKYRTGPFKSEQLGDWSYDKGTLATLEDIETTGDSKLDGILDKYRISKFGIGVV